MKHNINVTILLVSMFFIAQLIGLYVTDYYLVKELPLGIERPQFNPQTSYIPVFAIILVATLIAVIIAMLRFVRLWKFWFFLSVIFVLSISLSAFFNQYLAVVISIIVGYFKIIKPNIYIHNLSELFLYGGLSAMFVPVFNVFSVSILLLLIMGYDAIAVWKTKHMVKLAKFQSESKFFAGFLIPYNHFKKSVSGKEKSIWKKIFVNTSAPKRFALLGGGDIGFTLLFAGVIFAKYGLISLIIPVMASLGLLLLLILGNKNKFYPAMPFLGASCFIGYGLLLLLI
ncbi:MAG: presenilin family intramembrane aspartyl protease [Nanoarchaeota archaeon]